MQPFKMTVTVFSTNSTLSVTSFAASKKQTISSMADKEVPPARGLRLLSLDGGGIRGLSSLMILKHLMKAINPESPPKPCEVFDMIGGTSTGGLIAIMLGRLNMSVDACIEAYLSLCSDVFRRRRANWNLLGQAYDAWNVNGHFDSEALASGIRRITGIQLALQAQERSGESGINPSVEQISLFETALLMNKDSNCKSLVCAIREEFRDSPCLFRTYESRRALDIQPQIWEAARATSAATTFFDPIMIGPFRQKFVDGGLGFANPIFQVHDEAKDVWSNAKDNMQCIVSIGTGEPYTGPVGQNAPAVLKTLKELATETEATAALFAKYNEAYVTEGKYYRFNVVKGLEDVGLAEHEKTGQIASATDRYMEHDDQFAKVSQFQRQITGRKSQAPHGLRPSLRTDVVQSLLHCSDEVLLDRGTSLLDFSTSSMSLPAMLFTPEEQVYEFTDKEKIKVKHSWASVLRNYPQRQAEDDPRQDPRRVRLSVSEAPWFSGRGGCFLAHVPVGEIWRYLTSTQSMYTLEPGRNPYGVSIFIIGKYNDELLFDLDTGESAGGLNASAVASAEVANCVVGRGGLSPHGACGIKFSNAVPGLEKIHMPWTFFFTSITEFRSFFLKFVSESLVTMKELLRVLELLWDHEDAIDLDEHQVPIKVLLIDFSKRLTRFELRHSAPPNYSKLLRVSQAYFQTLSQRGKTFETEDALTCLKSLNQPMRADLDESAWTGHFGLDYARWVCLALTLNLVGNLERCGILSAEFDCLLESISGMCYVT